ncbi:MAG: hypothetical protein BWK73_25465 [Thiothrix lacustris]|uniref:Uncharacterized protein n=1 Tax=Thiothrix lacustris TaxID=525917 RepID=A0A1Y1QLK8_9GAMM|nr:MAG: hypothetical protein BWK73_25465 [Thiothrix lacustris]
MKQTIICINGPRGSGKDTLALSLRLQWLRMGGCASDIKFADPIEKAIAAMLPKSTANDFIDHIKKQHAFNEQRSPASP